MKWPTQKPIRNVPSLEKYTGVTKAQETRLSGIRPRLVGGTLFVALPAELQRAIEGGCQCLYCKDHPDKPPMWDALAIDAKAQRHTWTVHYPELASWR